MSDVSTPPSSPPRYTPPPEFVARAEGALRRAHPMELERAAACYEAYGSVTGGCSAVTGAKSPRFEDCTPLERAGWLKVGVASLRWGLSGAPRSDVSTPSPYFPPPELVAAAEDLLARARLEELYAAACLYDSFGTLGGSVYVASDKWPPFEECAVLTRARWLSVVRTSTQCGAHLLQLPSVERHGSEDTGDAGQVDPFLLGLGDIAAATKHLAEARKAVAGLPHGGGLGSLISTITDALHERVKALTPPAAP